MWSLLTRQQSKLRSSGVIRSCWRTSSLQQCSWKSTQPDNNDEEEVFKNVVRDVITFPSSSNLEQETPVFLNSQAHAVGYLSKVLNARVYEVSKETELQHAKNLSSVSTITCRTGARGKLLLFLYIFFNHHLGQKSKDESKNFPSVFAIPPFHVLIQVYLYLILFSFFSSQS